MKALRQVWLAALGTVGLLSATLSGENPEAHPLASLAQRLPQHGSLTQLADFQGQPLALFGDPAGRGLRLSGTGKPEWITTGLPGIDLLAGGNGPWLARAAGKLWYGTDGRTWVESAWPGPRKAHQVRRLDGMFYAWSEEYFESPGPGHRNVFHGPRLYRSPDGLQWQEITLAVPGRQVSNIRDILFHHGRYLLACYGTTLETGINLNIGCLTSEDGVIWSRVEGIDFHTTGAAFGGGKWLLTGQGYGKFALSTDGVHWTTHTHSFISNYLTNGTGVIYPVSAAMTHPVWLDSGFHCLTSVYSDRPVVAVSRDGLTWHSAELVPWDDDPGILDRYSLFSPRSGGLDVIAGQAWWWGDSATVWRSHDWLWGGTRVLPEESGDFFSAAASSNRVVALAGNGRVASSVDGRNWTFDDLPGDVVPSDVVWAPDLGEFLAIGDRQANSESGPVAQPHFWRSTDGRTWGVRRFPFPSVKLRAIARGFGKYVAVADRSMPHSSDGIEWRGLTALPGDVRFRDIAFGGDRFLVIDERGGLRHSFDGVTWHPLPTPFPSNANAGPYAVSHTGASWLLTGHYTSYSSADLIQWTPAAPEISFAHGEYIDATGSTSSTDGQTWFPRRPSTTGNTAPLWHPVRVAFRQSVVTVGPNGQISQTGDWRDYFGEWKAARFSADELAQPAIAGDDADPDRDGLGNLLEYALGLNPRHADAQDAVTLGQGLVDLGWGEPQPATTFSFPSWQDSYGVTLRVEYSENLVDWKTDDPDAHRTLEASPTPGARDRLSIHHPTASRPSKWMRLRAGR